MYKVWLQILKWDLLKVWSCLSFICLCPVCLTKGITDTGQAKSFSWCTLAPIPDNILCFVSWMILAPQTHACIQSLCCSVLGWDYDGYWYLGLPFPPATHPISKGPFPYLRHCAPPQGALCFLLSFLLRGQSQVQLPLTWGSHPVLKKSLQSPVSRTCFPFPYVFPSSFLCDFSAVSYSSA